MRPIQFVLSLFFVIFLLTSCRKADTDDNGFAPADASIAKYIFDAAKEEVDAQINTQNDLNGIISKESGPRGGCATVSISPVGLSFPKTVTIVFPAGCTTFAGAAIEGEIVISVSGRVREAGTVAKYTLDKFKYKGYTVSGDYSVIFNGNNSHTTEIKNGNLLTPEGKNITYTAINMSTQVQGLSTTFKTNPTSFLQDDVYEISTNSQGVNSKGNDFAISTDIPLVFAFACQWIHKGKITILEDSTPKITAVLDYGDGICDNKAILTFNNASINITLP